ncbi:related to NADPH:adrenodoxin oxidoreductase precursor, mitochondrial [Ustilago bromivora]|uniref:Related to NADPH:adrenodoxin oxidoreductase, mitochondrial n=1 Tax=Ustilago bromivora TaxID=307758 RepID=A0A1K0FZ86_9BASI|nr:related to NADPH:adrenodoxin oxidoreductase precursor, mitochondrial [Ustilago bromivora]SYW82482.1 related to NADPH:adrenodoxin oxidoreductase precursor, mitochondrial [Ustilago bromivora]
MRCTRLARAAAESSSSASTPSLPRKARVAIIGAGPSGFYAASRLLSRVPYSQTESAASQPLSIDIFDRLPVPHGLVRYGVAPDHPDVKNVENKFATVSQDPRLRFAGNVDVVHSPAHDRAKAQYPDAVQVPLELLSRYYTHILFSYGASTGRSLGIPGSAPGELEGVYTALEFVNWYSGHPASHDPILLAGSHFNVDFTNKHHMTVIGAGNVALDVARIVLRSSTPFFESSSGRVTSNKAPGLSALEETDVPEPVLAELAKCKVRHVDVFARRGPAQLAFTNKEVREMLSLEGVALRAPEKELLDSALVQLDELAAKGAADPVKANEIASEVRVKKRLLSILTKGSKSKVEEEVKTWGLNFFRSPAAFFAKEGGSKQVGSVKWDVTTLQSGQPTAANLDAADPKKATWGSGSTDSTPAASKSTATGKKVTTKTDIVVSSVGYQSEPLFSPSASTSPAVVEDGRLVQLPFDPSRRIVPNAGGRIIDPSTKNPIPNTYVSGWLARGPSGVIATTMMDAYGVADVILADLHSADQARTSGGEEGGDLLVQLQRESSNKVVGFEGWRRIDEQEKQRGQKLGKLREKILTVKEMLDIVN